MTEETVKEFMKTYSELKAQKEIMDKIQKYSCDEEANKKYSQLEIKIQIIESALGILTENERKIVMLHLINGVKWSEIQTIYEKQVGAELSYSERTFKRIQKGALEKIGKFLGEKDLERYITEA